MVAQESLLLLLFDEDRGRDEACRGMSCADIVRDYKEPTTEIPGRRSPFPSKSSNIWVI